jgi:Calcineurin-like phosphoesterase
MGRRQLLELAGLVAATPLLWRDPAQAAEPEVAPRRSPSASGPGFRAVELRVMTLTETSAVLTWYTCDPLRVDAHGQPAPVPARTRVRIGPSPLRLRDAVVDEAPTAYHHAVLTGLEPGRRYFFEASSNGVVALEAPDQLLGLLTAVGPGWFRTPQPPPGEHVLTVALLNDLHIGELSAGNLGGVGSGFPVDPANPYWRFTSRAAVAEAKAAGADLALVAGDLSAEAAQRDLAEAVATLNGFGAQGTDWLAVRGNHDRPHPPGAAVDACTRLPDGSHDCYADALAPGRPTWLSADLHGLHVVGLDTYDHAGTGADAGTIGAEQFAWLEADLRAHRDQPTVVFGHHPVTLESSLTTVGVQDVFLHHSGHTHRNRRTAAPAAPRVTFAEVAAVKEFPTGYALLRLFTGGYALNHYPLADAQCRAWSQRTRYELLGTFGPYAVGLPGDRNLVVKRDLSGLRPATASRAGWAVGGGVAAATAASGAAVAAARRRVRGRSADGAPPAISPG